MPCSTSSRTVPARMRKPPWRRSPHGGSTMAFANAPSRPPGETNMSDWRPRYVPRSHPTRRDLRLEERQRRAGAREVARRRVAVVLRERRRPALLGDEGIAVALVSPALELAGRHAHRLEHGRQPLAVEQTQRLLAARAGVVLRRR